MKPIMLYFWLTTAFLLIVAVSSLAQENPTPGPENKQELRRKRNRSKGVKTEEIRTSPAVYSAVSAPRKVNVGSKKQDYIVIDWVQPSQGNINLEKGMLSMKVKIFSSLAVRNENVSVFQNGVRLGSRMDVSNLFGEQEEFSYTNSVALSDGANEIVVEVTVGVLTQRSEPLVVHRKGNVASVSAFGASQRVADRSTSVYWWTTFDPVSLNGKPYTSTERVLPVRFKILTTHDLSRDSIAIYHNARAMAPGEKALLERDSQGNYTFADEIELTDVSDLNEIYLRVMTPGGSVDSEKLLVDYSPLRPNLHVLSIGTETNLQYTLKDARDFARLFTKQGGASGNRIFNKVMIDSLIGSAATAQEIKGTIEEMKMRYYTGTISPDDVILTFISSHGFLMEDDFRVQGDDYSPARQRSTSVSFRNDIVDVLDAIPCKKVIMIDACHSGGARANPVDINFEISKLNSIGKGLTVFASSRGEEQSYEDQAWQNGAFTASIVRGLSGRADADRNRIISLHELSDYVAKDVAAMVNKIKKRPQNPVLVNDQLGDVAIYVLD